MIFVQIRRIKLVHIDKKAEKTEIALTSDVFRITMTSYKIAIGQTSKQFVKILFDTVKGVLE